MVRAVFQAAQHALVLLNVHNVIAVIFYNPRMHAHVYFMLKIKYFI